MNHKTNLLIAFAIAVVLHAAAAVYVNCLRSGRSDAFPDFRSGGYSVSLMLAQPRLPPTSREGGQARPASAVPQPVKPSAVTPEPEKQVLVASEPQPPAPTEQTANQPDANDKQDASSNDSAGAGEQGVETLYVGLSDIRPHYPLGSRMRGEEGVVSITATVGSTGRASDVEVSRSSGYPALDREAVDAVKKAAFVARNASAKTAEKVTLSFRFKLTD